MRKRLTTEYDIWLASQEDMKEADAWNINDVDFDEAEVGLDRELVKKGGLYEFVKQGWGLIEPGEFKDNWHIGAVCEHLEAVTYGEIQNLLLLQPPGTMKSLLVSTFWPAWEWTLQAWTKFIYCSYGQSLANKNAKQHRELVKSDWYRQRWPETQLSTESLKQIKMFENTEKGFRFSTSVGGEVTGRHGDRLVFDDLVKAQEADDKPVVTDKSALHKANQFWFKTMSTREANPKTTSKVGIMQRLHSMDTAQLCIDTGDYTVLRLPMRYEAKYHCQTSWTKTFDDGTEEEVVFDDPRTEDGELLWTDHHDEEVVSKKEKVLGPTSSAAQLQQRPVPAGGNIWKKSWFQHWKPGPDGMPAGVKMDILIQSWDMSFKKVSTADYVCGQIWGMCDADMFLLDMIWARLSFTETISAMESMYTKWPLASKKLVEDAANGPAVADTLARKIPGIELVSPEGGKEARAYGSEPFWASRNVWIPPHTEQYYWVPNFIKQHIQFPFGVYDDAVDSGTQGVLYLSGNHAGAYLAALKKIRNMKNDSNQTSLQRKQKTRRTHKRAPKRQEEDRLPGTVSGSAAARDLLRRALKSRS